MTVLSQSHQVGTGFSFGNQVPPLNAHLKSEIHPKKPNILLQAWLNDSGPFGTLPKQNEAAGSSSLSPSRKSPRKWKRFQELGSDFPSRHWGGGNGQTLAEPSFANVSDFWRTGPQGNSEKEKRRCHRHPRGMADLPAPPHCDAVERVALQFMVVAKEINGHLIPLCPIEPGHHEVLGPQLQPPVLVDALSAPRGPNPIHFSQGTRPGH